jgi:hypothetical protein
MAASVVDLQTYALYSMASVSLFARGGYVKINFDSYDKESGTIVLACRIREDAPDQRKQDEHENGWAYYEAGPSGDIKPLSEEELAER